MSEATDRPTDDDAWAKACAEDLAAEKERLRGQGQAGAGSTGTPPKSCSSSSRPSPTRSPG